MRKFVLTFILSLLFISFAAFLYNAYILQNDYFESKQEDVVEEIKNDEVSVVPLSIYKNYSKEDYDNAISDKRIVVLFFTSNWCKECITQNKINQETFDTTIIQGVLGLNVHILDSDTTIETDALAKKFDISKENTFVFLNNSGAISSKHIGVLTKEQLILNIMKAGDMK